MGIVILDGMDRCGKTTIARRLQKVHERPLHMIHNGPPPEILVGADKRIVMLRTYIAQLTMAKAMDPSHDFIIDRSWPSESVYGHMYRGLPPIDAEWLTPVRKILDEVPHVIVIAADSAENVMQRTDGHSTFERQCADRKHCPAEATLGMQEVLDHAAQECAAFHEEYGALEDAGINTRWAHRKGPNMLAEEVMKIMHW
jgi:hypothetical protein